MQGDRIRAAHEGRPESESDRRRRAHGLGGPEDCYPKRRSDLTSAALPPAAWSQPVRSTSKWSNWGT